MRLIRGPTRTGRRAGEDKTAAQTRDGRPAVKHLIMTGVILPLANLASPDAYAYCQRGDANCVLNEDNRAIQHLEQSQQKAFAKSAVC
jgi:hypothetical protein